MSKNRWLVSAVSVIVVAAALLWYLAGGTEVIVDLIEEFPSAEQRSTLPLEQAFSVAEVTINGDTRRAIEAKPTSRIIWRLTLPRDAWLRVWLGVKPEAWTGEGDGVLFRIGVSDGRTYEELVNQLVDPINTPSDRRWFLVIADLSPYAGEQLDLIFNTNVGLPTRPPDDRQDLAVWGAPQVYVR